MMFSFKSNLLTINGQILDLVHPVLEALADAKRVFVLLDPDSFLSTSNAQSGGRHSQVTPNLLAFDDDGSKLWEAQLPEVVDYYYRLASAQPLVAYSFSSHRCELDPKTGKILRAEFLK